MPKLPTMRSGGICCKSSKSTTQLIRESKQSAAPWTPSNAPTQPQQNNGSPQPLPETVIQGGVATTAHGPESSSQPDPSGSSQQIAQTTGSLTGPPAGSLAGSLTGPPTGSPTGSMAAGSPTGSLTRPPAGAPTGSQIEGDFTRSAGAAGAAADSRETPGATGASEQPDQASQFEEFSPPKESSTNKKDAEKAASQLITQVNNVNTDEFTPGSKSRKYVEQDTIDNLEAQDPLRVLRNIKEPLGPLLGPQSEKDKGKKTLVLDLDETLVHSTFQAVPAAAFVIQLELDGMDFQIFVAKRPGVEAFLAFACELYEVVIFTASLEKYAEPLLERLDPGKLCPWRLYREACVQWQGNFIKDLSRLGRNLNQVIIVDNSATSSILQPDNAIPIRTWFDDANDHELYDLMPILRALATVPDIPAVLSRTVYYDEEGDGQHEEEDYAPPSPTDVETTRQTDGQID